jgi:hypothetical protein
MVNDELDCTYILILLTRQNDPNGNVVMVMIGCMYFFDGNQMHPEPSHPLFLLPVMLMRERLPSLLLMKA